MALTAALGMASVPALATELAPLPDTPEVNAERAELGRHLFFTDIPQVACRLTERLLESAR